MSASSRRTWTVNGSVELAQARRAMPSSSAQHTKRCESPDGLVQVPAPGPPELQSLVAGTPLSRASESRKAFIASVVANRSIHTLSWSVRTAASPVFVWQKSSSTPSGFGVGAQVSTRPAGRPATNWARFGEVFVVGGGGGGDPEPPPVSAIAKPAAPPSTSTPAAPATTARRRRERLLACLPSGGACSAGVPAKAGSPARGPRLGIRCTAPWLQVPRECGHCGDGVGESAPSR